VCLQREGRTDMNAEKVSGQPTDRYDRPHEDRTLRHEYNDGRRSSNSRWPQGGVQLYEENRSLRTPYVCRKKKGIPYASRTAVTTKAG